MAKPAKELKSRSQQNSVSVIRFNGTKPQPRKRPKRGRGKHTVEGRKSQIQCKLWHGIRGISPVLLGVEKDEDWKDHYKGAYQSLAPGNEFETDLVFLIAWQLWRFGRLIRHETALTTEKIHEPAESILDSLSR
jgi:hypothetical protein